RILRRPMFAGPPAGYLSSTGRAVPPRATRDPRPPRQAKPAMNLLCPNCQQQLSVQEQFAGQLMKCPLCGNNFTVPALPQAAAAPAPGGPAPAAAPAHAHDEDDGP